MIITTYNKQPNIQDEKLYLKMLINKPHYNRNMLISGILPEVKAENLSPTVRETFVMLFEKALATALLDIKRNIIRNLPTFRYKNNEIATEMLGGKRDYELINKLTTYIKHYNKHQIRLYYQHTLKNSPSIIKSLPRQTGINPTDDPSGNCYIYERAILEIEYILRKESALSTDSYNISKKIDEFALRRICQLSAWESFDIDNLGKIRDCYHMLRQFFLHGKNYNHKIPKDSYQDYMLCMKLIYDYVTAYTNPDFLDVAYQSLDASYLFYSYITTLTPTDAPLMQYSTIQHWKPLYLNEFTLPYEIQEFFYNIYGQCVEKMIGFIYYTQNHEFNFGKFQVEDCIDLFTNYISELYQLQAKPNHGNPFRYLNEVEYSPSLDEWILYDALWNNTVCVSQNDFCKAFHAKADSEFEILRFTMELIGIECGISNNIRNKLFDYIDSIKVKDKDLCDFSIRHLIQWIIREHGHTTCASDIYSRISDSDYSEVFKLNEDDQNFLTQKMIEEAKKYANYIKSHNRKTDFKKGNYNKVTDASIYQFIYRNFYGLGQPDIFTNSSVCSSLMVKRTLRRHNLSLTKKISEDDYTWLKTATDNLQQTNNAAYRRYQDYCSICRKSKNS